MVSENPKETFERKKRNGEKKMPTIRNEGMRKIENRISGTADAGLRDDTNECLLLKIFMQMFYIFINVCAYS